MVAQRMSGDRHGITKAQHQPVGSDMKNEAYLVGDRALAGGVVRGVLHLVHFD